MIAYLKGKIINKGNGFVIIAVNDLGYKVFVSQNFLAEMPMGQEAEIYTHQNVREDALDLYGFKNLPELEIFEMLISISGVGPKTALAVLAVGSADEIKSSIARGDSNFLTKVSGIGRKTAERVILELREKIQTLSAGTIGGATSGSEGSMNADEIDALMALGYSLTEARDVLRAVDPSLKKSSERIRDALRKLGR
jgi:holliday junction DNA helicase RuvA